MVLLDFKLQVLDKKIVSPQDKHNGTTMSLPASTHLRII